MTDSRIIHGTLTERSVSYPPVTHDRKGREGKGDRKGRGSRALLHSFLLPDTPTYGARDHAGIPAMPRAATGGGL